MRGGRLVKAPAFAARGGRRRRGLAGAREGAGGPSDGDLAAREQRSLAFLGRVVDGQEKDAEIRDRIAAARALAAHAVVARGRLPLPVAAGPAPVTPPAAPLRVLDPLSPEAQEQAQTWLHRARASTSTTT